MLARRAAHARFRQANRQRGASHRRRFDVVRSGRFPLAAGNARIHAIAIVRRRTPRHDPLAKRRRFIWLVLARGLHEQGDLDAVVDVELVEEAGDVGLDRGDGEVQRRGDLGVGLAPADG